MSNCLCGSGRTYDACCEPLHNGEAAKTAEALMRARYCAFPTGKLQYLEDTLTEASKKDYNAEETAEWAGSANWKRLEIVRTDKGGENDDTGVVEFRAYFSVNGQPQLHHEASSFEKIDGRWYYVDGIHNPKQEQRIVQKIGRNDPCTCGSGKKYKKCCGA